MKKSNVAEKKTKCKITNAYITFSPIQTGNIYRKAISKKIYSKASVIHALRKTNTKFRVTEKRREKWRQKQNKA